MSTITRSPFSPISTNTPVKNPVPNTQNPAPALSAQTGDTVHISTTAPLFAGRTRRLKDTWDSHGKKVEGEESQVPPKQAEVDELNRKIKRIDEAEDNGKGVGEVLGGGTGAVGGFAAGAVGSTHVLFVDGGSLALAGGVAGYKGGAKAGGEILGKTNKWLGEKLWWGNQGDLIKKRNEKQGALDILKTRVQEGQDVLRALLGMKPKAQTAIHAKGVFEDEEYDALAKAQNTDYMEVDDEYHLVKPLVIKVPGFKDLFEKVTGKPLGRTEKGIDAVLGDLRSQDEATQILALKRLHGLESGNLKHSKVIYPEFLDHTNPKVATTALRLMNENPVLRGTDQQYTQALEKFLASGNPEKIQAALEGVMASKLKSNTINLLLERISHPSAPYKQKLKNEALRVASHRFTQGTNRELNPRETSRRILEGMVGNQDMQRQLMKVIHQYQGALRAAGNNSPALVLYLEGNGGIGKTTMLQRLQTELHDDPNGLKVIKMGDLRDQEDLLKKLREAQPLQGKTIFLDEFQNLDDKELDRGRPGIIRVLKNLFATEDETGTGEHEMKAVHGIDVKDTILAVATNRSLDKMTSLADADIGQSVRSRILGPAHYLDLEPDMRQHLPQLVEGFSKHRYYDKVTKRTFDGRIILSEQAKEALTRELSQLSKRTSDHSGRNYVNQIAKEIDTAIGAMDIKTRKQLATDDKGRIIDSLTIEVDDDGFLVAKPTV